MITNRIELNEANETLVDLVHHLGAHFSRYNLNVQVLTAHLSKKHFAAIVAQGSKLETVNKKRAAAQLGPIKDFQNHSLVKKSWTQITEAQDDLGQAVLISVGYGSKGVKANNRFVKEVKDIAKEHGVYADYQESDVSGSFILAVKEEESNG